MDRPANPDKPFHACEAFGMDYFDLAPERHRFEVELDISPEGLFAVFEDPDAWPNWAWPGIVGVDWTSDKPYGPGTTRTVHLVGGLDVYEDFFVWDPPHQMAFHLYGATEKIWSRFGEHYAVTDLGNDRCKLVWRFSSTPAGIYKWLMPPGRLMIRFVLGGYMRRLQKVVRERAPGQIPDRSSDTGRSDPSVL